MANSDDRKLQMSHALWIDRRERSPSHLALSTMTLTSFFVGYGENLKRYVEEGVRFIVSTPSGETKKWFKM